MKVTDYRDMYYAISNGIEIGLSIDSVLEEVVAERENGNISAKDYNELMVFFKECDRKHGAQIVEHNHAVWLRQQRELEDQNRQVSGNKAKTLGALLELTETERGQARIRAGHKYRRDPKDEYMSNIEFPKIEVPKPETNLKKSTTRTKHQQKRRES